MGKCWKCRQEASEVRDKDGWTVCACSGWFDGRCSGLPVGVVPPAHLRQERLGVNYVDDGDYFDWMNKRVREIFPLEATT